MGIFNYFGMTEGTFKKRYNNHMYDVRHPESNGTTLGKKIQELQNSNRDYKVTWSIVDRAYPYTAGAKSCDLCAAERCTSHLAEKASRNYRMGAFHSTKEAS